MFNGLNLTILAGPTVPVPVPATVVESLESIKVTTQGGKQDGFELRFAVPKKSSLVGTFLIEGTRTPDMRMILAVTLRGTPHVIADGVISHHQVDSSGKQPKFVLQGKGLATLMDREDRTGNVEYMGLPPTLRVLAILSRYAKYGLIPLVLPSIGNAIPNPFDKSPKHRGTDLAYIELLAQEAGNEFFILPGPALGTNLAYWGPATKLGVPQPSLNVDMDIHRNVENLTFRVDAEQHEAPTITIHEPITKMAIPISIPSFNPLSPSFGRMRPEPALKTRVAGTSKKSLAEALIQGFAAAAASQDTVFGSGTLNVGRYGHVLKARHPVTVRGATDPFDGLYYVQQVTHEIERGKYTQSFELRRDGLLPTISLASVVSA